MQAKSAQSGFTVVEMLIAAVIIAVGILAWTRTQDSSIRARAKSNNITSASELAMAKMEALSLEAKTSKIASSNAPEKITQHGVTYELEWDVDSSTSSVNGTASVNLVELTVNWNHYGKKSLSYQRVIAGN